MQRRKVFKQMNLQTVLKKLKYLFILRLLIYKFWLV